MSLWKKLILWCVLWIPFSFIFQNNPHFPSSLFAPLIGFFSFCDAEGWQGNHFFELTLPWFCFWAVLFAIVDLHLANQQSNVSIFKLKPRFLFWLAGCLLFLGLGLFIRHKKQMWPIEDCERLNGQFNIKKHVCEFPK